MKQPCRQPYCSQLVESGYCEKHRNNDTTSFKNKKAHPFYNAVEWRGINGLRRLHLRMYPFCVDCRKEGRTITATVVDHITPFARHKDTDKQWELFTDPRNLQSLCAHHHAVKTGRGE